MDSEPKPRGRPPKLVKEINPVRQVGRWTDADWQVIRNAAAAASVDVATWCKSVLVPAARRRLRKSD